MDFFWCVAEGEGEENNRGTLSRGESAALGNFLELRDFCAGNFCRHFSFKWKFLLKEEQQPAHLELP